MTEAAWVFLALAIFNGINGVIWAWRSLTWKHRFYELRRVKAEEIGIHVATNIDRVMRGFGMTPQEDEFPEVIDER